MAAGGKEERGRKQGRKEGSSGGGGRHGGQVATGADTITKLLRICLNRLGREILKTLKKNSEYRRRLGNEPITFSPSWWIKGPSLYIP
jgi:hypothetical protein